MRAVSKRKRRLKRIAAAAFGLFLVFSVPAFALLDDGALLCDISSGIALASLFAAGAAFLGVLLAERTGRGER